MKSVRRFSILLSLSFTQSSERLFQGGLLQMMETYNIMTFVFALVFSVSLAFAARGQNCPATYLRFSREHSFCKAPNPNCAFINKGVTEKEIAEILDVHNKYRSQVAMGKETNAGGLPTAADMIQMVWDPELAAIAQKRAEQCIFAHDCSDCRGVENFPVGQNIAYQDKYCFPGMECPEKPIPEWTNIIKMFYDEVSLFNKQYVNSVMFIPGVKFGHFTQIVWSKTWRIGCGYVAFKQGSGNRKLYVCNYGPSGNMVYEPLYKAGPTCSACPTNTCCGSSCPKADYPGLCKMSNSSQAPAYPTEAENDLNHCQFEDIHGDCEVHVSSGSSKWNLKKTLGGTYVDILLNGGESSILTLKKLIKPKARFCLILKYRSIPAESGQRANSKAVVIFEPQNSGKSEMSLPMSGTHQFYSFDIDIGWNFPTKVSLSFSVPPGAPAQIFDISEISAKEGICIKKMRYSG